MFSVNGIKWKEVFVPSDADCLEGAVAVCDNNTKTIYVREGLRDEDLRKVLSHELTHAAMFSYDIHLSLKQEELLADLLATYGEEIIVKANELFERIKRKREA